MRKRMLIVASSCGLICAAGCAPGPLGPPLGLGPGLDQLVFWAGIFLVGLLLWPRIQRYLKKNSRTSGSNQMNASLETVAERYAKGEINRDEYLKMMDDLRRGTA